jgi:hypothetical protein
VFIANHFKTELFYKVSIQLNDICKVYWISASYYWSKWLLNRGIKNEQILDVSNTNDTIQVIKDSMFETETKSRLFSHDIILMDRILSKKDYELQRKFVAYYHSKVEEFLLKNRIKAVFGEQTWAIELITASICSKHKISYLVPHTTRIPDERFAFFVDNQADYVRLNQPCSDDFKKAKEYFREYLETRPKPGYFYKNNIIPKPKIEWLGKFFYHLFLNIHPKYKLDITRYSLTDLMRKKINEVKNTWIISLLRPFDKVNKPQRPYVLYALHKQPEASIDVLGSYFSNQLETIKTISRSIPFHFELYVKEHSNSVGDRGIKYYRELKKIPGVKLISPSINSHDLIRNAELVITVSGTIAYEAALMGVPSMTIAPMFFGPILTINGFNPYSKQLKEYFVNQKKIVADEEIIIKFLADLFCNSFPGIISDTRSDPRCISNENINNLTNAFKLLLNAIENGFLINNKIDGEHNEDRVV